MKELCFFISFFCILDCFSQDKVERYILKYKDVAIIEMNMYGIPASITLSQGILESGSGESRLAVEGNNHFGIKCHKNWNGKTIIADDDKNDECFRKYAKVSESYRDHSLFLTERGRYSFLFDYKRTDYKAWAKGLKKAGYATNPRYSELLIDLIKKYNLDEYDKEKDTEKRLYFAHSYGFPYLMGVGSYYFDERSFYSLNINTSFLFSNINIGYQYNLFSNFYSGAGMGVMYVPSEEIGIVKQVSIGVMYNKKNKNNSILFNSGIYYSLNDFDPKIIPYISLTYLFP